MKQITTISLEPEILAQVDKLAEQERRTRSAMIEICIQEYQKQKEVK